MSSDQNKSTSAEEIKLPKYLEKFQDKLQYIPAGHRHTIYWNTDDEGKSKLLNEIANNKPSDDVQEMWKALQERSSHIANGFRAGRIQVTEFPFELQANLLCGSGLSHPTEVGMSFMNPYGIPYIPGSSIKGVLRDAAQMLAKDERDNLTVEDVNKLFGEDNEGQESKRGHLSFLDSLPLGSQFLGVDIITPHHKAYFQGSDNAYPHDEESPVPIQYLVVKKNTKFNLVILHGHDTTDSEEQECAKKVEEIVKYAIENMGFGAKTSIGYGWVRIDEERKQRDERQRKEAEERRRKEEEDKTKAAQAAAERQAERESLNEDEQWAYDCIEKARAAYTTGNTKPATIVKHCLEHIDDSTDPERLKALGRRLMDKVMEGRLKDKTEKKAPAKDDEYQASIAIKELLNGRVPKWGGQ